MKYILTLIMVTLAAVGCADDAAPLDDAGTLADASGDETHANVDAGSAGFGEGAAGAAGSRFEEPAGSGGGMAGSSPAGSGAAGQAGGNAGTGQAGSSPAGSGGSSGSAGSAQAGSGAAGMAGSAAGSGAAGAAGSAAQPVKFCKLSSGSRVGCDEESHTLYSQWVLGWRADARTTAYCGSGKTCPAGNVCKLTRPGTSDVQSGVCQ